MASASKSSTAKSGAWTEDEDQLLYYWQGVLGNKWSSIAQYIPGRTGQQCAQRWRHKVNPDIVHSAWSEEEDALLLSLVAELGHHWAAIARRIPGRTDQQCLGRWRRRLDPSISRGEWTAEEDEQLIALHDQCGNSWSQISKIIRGRTSQQCRGRFFQLSAKVTEPKPRRKSQGKSSGSQGGPRGSLSPPSRANNPPPLLSQATPTLDFDMTPYLAAPDITTTTHTTGLRRGAVSGVPYAGQAPGTEAPVRAPARGLRLTSPMVVSVRPALSRQKRAPADLTDTSPTNSDTKPLRCSESPVGSGSSQCERLRPANSDFGEAPSERVGAGRAEACSAAAQSETSDCGSAQKPSRQARTVTTATTTAAVDSHATLYASGCVEGTGPRQAVTVGMVQTSDMTAARVTLAGSESLLRRGGSGEACGGGAAQQASHYGNTVSERSDRTLLGTVAPGLLHHPGNPLLYAATPCNASHLRPLGDLCGNMAPPPSVLGCSNTVMKRKTTENDVGSTRLGTVSYDGGTYSSSAVKPTVSARQQQRTPVVRRPRCALFGQRSATRRSGLGGPMLGRPDLTAAPGAVHGQDAGADDEQDVYHDCEEEVETGQDEIDITGLPRLASMQHRAASAGASPAVAHSLPMTAPRTGMGAVPSIEARHAVIATVVPYAPPPPLPLVPASWAASLGTPRTPRQNTLGRSGDPVGPPVSQAVVASIPTELAAPSMTEPADGLLPYKAHPTDDLCLPLSMAFGAALSPGDEHTAGALGHSLLAAAGHSLHGTPDSIVRILRSPRVPGDPLRSMTGLGDGAGLGFPLGPTSFADAVRGFVLRGSTGALDGADVSQDAAHPSGLDVEPRSPVAAAIHADAAAAGELRTPVTAHGASPVGGDAGGTGPAGAAGPLEQHSPHGPCLSNWSEVPAQSWGSFQRARHQLQELDHNAVDSWRPSGRTAGASASRSGEPTPVSSKVHSRLNDSDNCRTPSSGAGGARGETGLCERSPSVVPPAAAAATEHAGTQEACQSCPSYEEHVAQSGDAECEAVRAPGADAHAGDGSESSAPHALSPPVAIAKSSTPVTNDGAAQGSAQGAPSSQGRRSTGPSTSLPTTFEDIRQRWQLPAQTPSRPSPSSRAPASIQQGFALHSTAVAAAGAEPRQDAQLSPAAGAAASRVLVEWPQPACPPPSSTNYLAGPGARAAKNKSYASPSKKLRISSDQIAGLVELGDADSAGGAEEHGVVRRAVSRSLGASPCDTRKVTAGTPDSALGHTGDAQGPKHLRATSFGGLPASGPSKSGPPSPSIHRTKSADVGPHGEAGFVAGLAGGVGSAFMLPTRRGREAPGYPGYGRPAQCQSLLEGFHRASTGERQDAAASLSRQGSATGRAPPLVPQLTLFSAPAPTNTDPRPISDVAPARDAASSVAFAPPAPAARPGTAPQPLRHPSSPDALLGPRSTGSALRLFSRHASVRGNRPRWSSGRSDGQLSSRDAALASPTGSLCADYPASGQPPLAPGGLPCAPPPRHSLPASALPGNSPVEGAAAAATGPRDPSALPQRLATLAAPFGGLLSGLSRRTPSAPAAILRLAAPAPLAQEPAGTEGDADDVTDATVHYPLRASWTSSALHGVPSSALPSAPASHPTSSHGVADGGAGDVTAPLPHVHPASAPTLGLATPHGVISTAPPHAPATASGQAPDPPQPAPQHTQPDDPADAAQGAESDGMVVSPPVSENLLGATLAGAAAQGAGALGWLDGDSAFLDGPLLGPLSRTMIVDMDLGSSEGLPMDVSLGALGHETDTTNNHSYAHMTLRDMILRSHSGLPTDVRMLSSGLELPEALAHGEAGRVAAGPSGMAPAMPTGAIASAPAGTSVELQPQAPCESGVAAGPQGAADGATSTQELQPEVAGPGPEVGAMAAAADAAGSRDKPGSTILSRWFPVIRRR